MSVKHYKLIIFFLAMIIILLPIVDYYLFKPRDSLELHQALAFSGTFEKAGKLMLDGNQSNLSIEDYNTISERQAVYGIYQYTLLEYGNKTFLIETTPGGKKLEIIRVTELPEEVSDFLIKD
ncbi:hypothetical protein NSQ43_13040 [Sporosarcina sp. FSL W8-0480]|uniref:hypothetical protein n=1 Tax=Sporosarcina sp. FSL W8-0480 TaxID=2954701 RepID=UPI0030D9510E